MGRLSSLIFAALALMLTVSAWAGPSVVVYISKPMGGFGDVAANLIMGEQIRRYGPEGTSVRFIYHPDAAAALGTLVPSLDPALPQAQEIGGVTYQSSIAMGVLHVDYAFSFSRNSRDSMPVGLHANHQALYVHEPGMWMNTTGSLDGMDRHSVSGPRVWDTAHSEGTGTWYPDAETQGLYLAPVREEPVMSREALVTELSRLIPGAAEALAVPGVRIAYGYTKQEGSLDRYIEALKRHAQRGAAPVVAFVKEYPNHSYGQLAPNLVVLPLAATPFAVGRALTEHSEITPLLTGDASMAMRLNQDRFFFYEMNAWKMLSAESLVRLLGEADRDLAPGGRFHRDLSEALFIEPDSPMTDVNLLERLLEPTPLSQAFSSAVQAVHPRLSLARLLIRLMGVMDQLEGSKKIGKKQMSFLLQVLQGAPEGTLRLNELMFNEAFNEALPPEERVIAATLYAACRDVSVEDRAAMALTLMEEGGGAVRARLRAHLAHSTSHRLSNAGGTAEWVFDLPTHGFLQALQQVVRNGTEPLAHQARLLFIYLLQSSTKDSEHGDGMRFRGVVDANPWLVCETALMPGN